MSFPVGRRVLRDADGHLFEVAVRAFDVSVLRIDLEPAPLVVARRAVDIVGLAGAEREEIGDRPVGGRVGQVVGIGHDTGFAFPDEPQVFVASGLVQVVIELPQRDERVRSRAEREHESYFRNVHSVFLRLIPGFEQRFVGVLPCQASVRTVEEHGIDACVGQHFGVLAKHPRVGRLVVSQQGLFPEEKAGLLRAPCRMMVVFHRLGMLSDDFGDVLDTVGRVVVPLMPCPVEHGDELVGLLGTCFLVIAHLAAERVRRGPRVAADRLGRSRSAEQ